MNIRWLEYHNDIETFGFTVHIPVNNGNYIEKVMKFDIGFLQLADVHGMHKIHSLTDEVFTLAEFEKGYIPNRISQLQDESEDIALMCIYHWDLFRENVHHKKRWDISIRVPVKTEDKWEYKDLSIAPYRYGLPWQSFSLGINSKDLKDGRDVDLTFDFFSKSNIWLDDIELDDTSIGKELEKYGYSTFDPPFDNRPTAYRITPRFNSFLRDLKQFVDELNGWLEAEEMIIPASFTYAKNPEGYILLDGQLIFQEDIDSGKIKIPD